MVRFGGDSEAWGIFVSLYEGITRRDEGWEYVCI